MKQDAPPPAVNPEERVWADIPRRHSRQIMLGKLPVGGGAPIWVQSMLNTPSEEEQACLQQLETLEQAGAELVRVSCPTPESTKALKSLVQQTKLPLIADIHFHHQRALEAADAGAVCLRVNPGNIGKAERVREVVQAAKQNNAAIRIGVNAGSLEADLLDKYRAPCPDALVESALRHIDLLEREDFHNYKVSIKASDVFLTYQATQALAEKVDCPLHIGITEAGSAYAGLVKSSVGLGRLLWAGIGDTIRVSLSAPPADEIKAGFEILKALGLRDYGVTIISCPSCARQGFDVIGVVQELEKRLAHIRAPITLAIMGCVVNGPGEARQTDFGFTGGGAGQGRVYLNGKVDAKLANTDIVEHFVRLVEARAKELAAEL